MKKLIDSKQLERVVTSRAVVEGYRKSGLTMTEYAENVGVPIYRISRLNKRFGDGSDSSVFCDQRSSRKGGSRIDRNALAFAISYIHARPKAPMTKIFLETNRVGETNNWSKVGYKQLVRAIKGLSPDVALALREGMRAHFEQASMISRKIPGSVRQTYQVDTSELKVWCLDVATGTYFKPHLSAAICCHSKALVGWRLHKSAPDGMEILRFLYSTLSAKGDERYPCLGTPELIHCDNGKALRSTLVLDVAQTLGFAIMDSPAYCPSAQGVIERVWGSFDTRLTSSLQGYARQYRGLTRARKEAIVYPQMEKILSAAVHEYNHAPHSSLADRTPIDVWMEGLQEARGSILSKSELDDAFRYRKTVHCNRDGIELWGRMYASENLVGWVGTDLIAKLPLYGVADKVEVFSPQGDFIDWVKPSEDHADLRTAIDQARLTRSGEIQALAKVLDGLGSRMIPPPKMDGGEIPTSVIELDERKVPEETQLSSGNSDELDSIRVENLKPVEEEEL